MRVTPLALSLGLCALGLLGRPVLAQTTIWDHHVDIGIDYTALGGWDLHIHDEDDLLEYAPDEAILGVGWQAEQPRPAGAGFDFIGVSAGQPVWILPQIQDPALNFLGIGAEELDPDDLLQAWDPDGAGPLASAKWLQIDLLSVTGPGHFSLWTNSGSTVSFASADGIGSADRAFVLAGGHSHFNWTFTQPGTYAVELQVTSTLAGGGTSTSAPATYTFSVAAAPEPGTLALLAIGGTLVIVRRRCR